MLITDLWFYAVAVPSVLLVGISKGGFGAGLGMLAVPLMTLIVAPAQSAAILLPILCLMDLVGLGSYRKRWDRGNMIILLPAAVVGIAIGGLTFRYLDDRWIELMLGLLAVGFTIYRLVRDRISGEAVAGRDWVKGSFWGALSGFTSFVAHAGGPPLSVYLLPQRLDKTIFVGTSVIFFAVVNYVKLVPYAWLGQFDATNLWTSLVLAPLAPLGVWLGMWLHGRLSDKLFYRICYSMLVITGGKLIWDATLGRGGLLT